MLVVQSQLNDNLRLSKGIQRTTIYSQKEQGMKFRETTPKRQNITKEVSDYHEHKINLQKDFRGHCGYCNDRDWPRREFFEIDHFVPKVMLTTIKDTDYSNLVYSCRSCNNAKRKNGQQEKNTYIMMGIKVG